MYENENTTYQNVWEAAITMVRGKFMTRNPLLNFYSLIMRMQNGTAMQEGSLVGSYRTKGTCVIAVTR